MARSLLITQCLQNDFTGPLGPHESPPSRLHIGHAEAERLLGRDPMHGALSQLIGWVRAQPTDTIEVLHVRDWHEPSVPLQRAHLDAFGDHCIAGSHGAALVLGLDSGMRANESYVDALHLNDFVETDLEARLRALIAVEGPAIRVAVVGVWTDAKVSFLCYELITRLGLANVATCAALTASSSREKHFVALDSLAMLLGVTVTNSPAELASFLCPEASFAANSGNHGGTVPRARGPHVDAPSELGKNDADALAWLYREARSVRLSPLSGGFSGAAIYAVASEDVLGHALAPTVLKLGPRELVAKERVAFERVESVLGNDVPHLLAAGEFGDRGALKFSFATMGRGAVHTLKQLYHDGLSVERFTMIVDEVFGDILNRFAEGAQYEPCSLLVHYGFAAHHADSVAARADSILQERDEPAALSEGLVRFYRTELERLGRPQEHHYVAYVHGDLNGANVLLDDRSNVWLIDFAHTARRHILNDLVKLENDLLFLFLPLASEEALRDACVVVDFLTSIEDLAEPLPDTLQHVHDPEVLRAYACVGALRRHVARYCREDRSTTQWSVAALRYAAHTLSFPEADLRQRRLALHAASAHAAGVVAGYRDRARLVVGWVDPGDSGAPRRLGMTLCPGRRDRGRDLDADLDTLVEERVVLLVCLLPDEELRWADVGDLGTRAQAKGIDFVQLPIPDQATPSAEELETLLATIDAALVRGNVVVHCMGGLGRSGTVTACLLVRHGADAKSAIASVRRARGPRCIETREQEAFVERYAP